MSTGSGEGRRRNEQTRAWTPNKKDPRAAAPTSIGELLVGAQAHVAKMSGAFMTHVEWREIVGAKIAARSRVGKMSRGVLVIQVASSAWCSELSFLRSDLLARLARAGHEVRDLRFVVDRIGSVTESRRSWFAKKRNDSVPEGDDSLPAELERSLLKIEDPNLRAAIAEAARHSLKRR